MHIVFRLIINTLSVFATSYLLPGVHIPNFWIAIVVAVILAILNVTLKPLLIFLTLPATVITFGLFLLVVNALVILAASSLIQGFTVDGFWWALLFGLVLSLINSILMGLGEPPRSRDPR